MPAISYLLPAVSLECRHRDGVMFDRLSMASTSLGMTRLVGIEPDAPDRVARQANAVPDPASPVREERPGVAKPLPPGLALCEVRRQGLYRGSVGCDKAYVSKTGAIRCPGASS